MSLVRDVSDMTRLIEDGEWPGVDALDSLGDRLRAEAPELPYEEVVLLAQSWQGLEDAVRRAKEGVQRRLQRLDRAEGALKGYAHLRPHNRGQRVRRVI